MKMKMKKMDEQEGRSEGWREGGYSNLCCCRCRRWLMISADRQAGIRHQASGREEKTESRKGGRAGAGGKGTVLACVSE